MSIRTRKHKQVASERADIPSGVRDVVVVDHWRHQPLHLPLEAVDEAPHELRALEEQQHVLVAGEEQLPRGAVREHALGHTRDVHAGVPRLVDGEPHEVLRRGSGRAGEEGGMWT